MHIIIVVCITWSIAVRNELICEQKVN